jgi:hypothetical protein
VGESVGLLELATRLVTDLRQLIDQRLDIGMPGEDRDALIQRSRVPRRALPDRGRHRLGDIPDAERGVSLWCFAAREGQTVEV